MITTKQAVAQNIYVDNELWGYAIQVNGRWWLLYQRDEEGGDLEYFNAADTEFEIRQKVRQRLADEEAA